MATFIGDDADNVFNGDGSNDTAYGNGGNDLLSGGGGADLLVGGTGGDTLDGGDGEDRLFSNDYIASFSLPYYNGNSFTPPVIDAGVERDVLRGGDGSDRIFAGYGDGVDGGGDGYAGDYLYISFIAAPAGISFDGGLASQVIGGATITGIENVSFVQGSNFADTINGRSTGTGYSDFGALMGMGGNDTLIAGYYTGTLYGGDGDDVVDGRGSQYLQAVYGDDGNDTLYTNSNTFAVAYGGAGNDTIYAHGGVYGGSGNDLIIMQPTYYSGTVYGDDGDDEIRASANGSVISGGDGADRLTGGDGADVLGSAGVTMGGSTPLGDDMGSERDVVTGGGGNDIVGIGYGDDADGGAGSDQLRLSLGGAAAGVVFDTAGITGATPFAFAGGTIVNFETLVSLRGSEFADTLSIATQTTGVTVDGGGGNDVIIAHGSTVNAQGGAGDDRFVSGIAGDTFDGGAGFDTIDYSAATAGVTVRFDGPQSQTSGGPGGDSFVNVEAVIGSAFNDSLTGSSNAQTLSGGAGNDLLDGGAGADTLIGGTGDDTYVVDNAGDVVTELADEGLDTVRTTLAAYTLGANVENLTYAGSAGFAGAGNAAANTITGGSGDDLLNGGAGTDTLVGGLGNDVYVVDVAGDIVTEAAGGGTDEVQTTLAQYTLAENVERLTGLTASGQMLTGNALANLIAGGSGADTMAGRGGDDVYVVDNAGDVVTEAADEGIDTVRTTLAAYTLGANVENLTYTGSVGFAGTGNAAANIIVGGAGNDVLNGGAGADTLVGGLGNDVLIGGLGDDLLDGGAGTDVAVIAATRAATSISGTLGGDLILSSADGTDTLRGIETIRFTTGDVTTVTFYDINTLYAAYLGRGATSSELDFWSIRIDAGNPLSDVRSAILADPAGIAHTAATVTSLYQQYLGRDPVQSELGYWDAQVRGGTDFTGVRSIIIADPSGQAHTDATVTALYQTYLGRAPAAAELSFWSGQVRGGTDFTGVRGAILDDPSGQAHTGATVTALYQEYGGRAASSAEIGFWSGQVRGGSDFNAVRNAILDDALGRAHTASALGTLYQEYFGRGASMSDIAVWDGLFHRGVTFDTTLDTLLRDRGSDATGVHRYAATPVADTIALGSDIGHSVVAGFDPAADRLDLRGAGYAGVNPLDAAHARQVYALDGTPDVLITFDPHHNILLQGLQLAQLSGADFLL